MCFGIFPNPVDEDIAKLQVGDQIIVLAGEGYPEFERDRVDIIWKIDGFSALTAEGISINCHNISKVVRTGNYFDSFLASAEAKAIWQNILENRDETHVTTEAE